MQSNRSCPVLRLHLHHMLFTALVLVYIYHYSKMLYTGLFYKSRYFTHRFGGGNATIKVPEGWVSTEGFSLFSGCYLLAVEMTKVTRAEKQKSSSALKPRRRAWIQSTMEKSSWPNYLPKARSEHPHLELHVLAWEFWQDMCIQAKAHTYPTPTVLTRLLLVQ